MKNIKLKIISMVSYKFNFSVVGVLYYKKQLH